MEDMKNLIIQSLETKGVLGQIRAQLRSSVFKIVDEQDQQFNYGCGLKWENPTLYKILETKIGTLLAEIIRDFMEYFRMDYSLSIFIPECGISPERLKKEEIWGKIGLSNSLGEDFISKLQLPLIYYIMYYFIQEVKDNPQKVMDNIMKVQNDIEKKSDEIIENNFIEYFKAHRGEEDDIPLSNNERINQQNENNYDNKNINKNLNNNKNINNEEDDEDKEETPIKSYEYEENRKDKLSLDNPKEINRNIEEQIHENVDEEIMEEIDESIGGGSSNKKSSGVQNSQSLSGTQHDNTVNSNALENYNFYENAQKPEN